MKYTKGYKYQLNETLECVTSIHPWQEIETQFINITREGNLTIRKGYSWDGASGGWDSRSFMRASLIHDALCQLINEKLLPRTYQIQADKLLKEICLEDGMFKIRAWWVYRAVRRFDKIGLKKYKPKEVYTAP